MDIRILHYFVTIVQTKSISNAANALHLTQPTLSRQIKELEEELGTVLFHRGSREIQITDDGQYLYNRALDILSLVEKTESNLKSHNDLTGQLYIGAAETPSLAIIAQAIKRLHQEHPKVTAHIRSGNVDDILEKLDQGIYDLGITFGTYDKRKYQGLDLTSHDLAGVLVPKNHPLTAISKLRPADIVTYPLIVSAQSSLSLIDPDLQSETKTYQIVATYNLLYNASLLVKEGVGIALCLGNIIDTRYEDSELVFLPFAQQASFSLQIIWKKQSKQSVLAKYFLKILKQIQAD